MKIKGIRTVKPVDVDLSEYFDQPTKVTVRPLPPLSRAKIQERLVEGMRYATSQGKKTLDINSIEQAMPAEVTMEIRAIKLQDGVTAHTIQDEDGKPLVWGTDLWAALDEADPEILGKVVEAVTQITTPDDEEGEDPTLPTRNGRK
jgi:hypothetical protein